MIVAVFRFCSGLGSDPMAGDVRDFPRQSEGFRQRCLRPLQLEHGVHHHQNLPRYDGESSLVQQLCLCKHRLWNIRLVCARSDQMWVKILFLFSHIKLTALFSNHYLN